VYFFAELSARQPTGKGGGNGAQGRPRRSAATGAPDRMSGTSCPMSQRAGQLIPLKRAEHAMHLGATADLDDRLRGGEAKTDSDDQIVQRT